jgi:predicted GNAT family acetyltransferase
MALQLIEHHDPREFHDAVIDYLSADEAECCAQIGLVGRMKRDGYSPVSVDELDQPILWTIQDGPVIDLVAIQTLRRSMIVTRGSTEAMELLADELVNRGWDGNGLTGVTPSILTLVEGYSARSLRAAAVKIRLRVFQLEQVVWPRPVSGIMRICQPEDRELLARFIAGFEANIGEPSGEDAPVRADRFIADGRMFFWADPQPVAMAAWAGPTPRGIRVNWVYTAPEFRGRGYASSLVAHLTQKLLDEGRKYCFLFTDLSNPTSNSIYQKIGYRAIADSERWEFDEVVNARL